MPHRLLNHGVFSCRKLQATYHILVSMIEDRGFLQLANFSLMNLQVLCARSKCTRSNKQHQYVPPGQQLSPKVRMNAIVTTSFGGKRCLELQQFRISTARLLTKNQFPHLIVFMPAEQRCVHRLSNGALGKYGSFTAHLTFSTWPSTLN